MVRLSSHRLPFSLSAGAITPIILPPPGPITTSHRGWGFPIIRPRVRQARRPHDAGLVELRLSGVAHDRMSAREWATGALELRASGSVEYRPNDDLLALFLAGALNFDDLSAMGADAMLLELVLLLD